MKSFIKHFTLFSFYQIWTKSSTVKRKPYEVLLLYPGILLLKIKILAVWRRTCFGYSANVVPAAEPSNWSQLIRFSQSRLLVFGQGLDHQLTFLGLELQ